MIRLNSLAVFASLSLGAVVGCANAVDGVATDEASRAGEEQLRMMGTYDVATADVQGGTGTTTSAIKVVRFPTIPVGTIVLAPPTADLKLDGVMRYYGGGTPTLGLQINVTNIGDSPAHGTSGRVNVAGYVLSAALYQYFGGTATQPNTVNPGERGYIKVEVPASLMSSCTAYNVQIDLDHTMQTGTGVFANDSGSVSTVCPLTWNTPIEELYLGHAPDPSVQGKSLFNIVSSFVSGRPDGALCSSCHNSGSSYPYHPNVAPNGSAAIDPFLPASGDQTWICAVNPWGPQFVNLPVAVYPHTPHLKEAVQKWMTDGGIR